MAKFTDRLYERVEPIWASYMEHPFIKGLEDGSLGRREIQTLVETRLYLFNRICAAICHWCGQSDRPEHDVHLCITHGRHPQHRNEPAPRLRTEIRHQRNRTRTNRTRRSDDGLYQLHA